MKSFFTALFFLVLLTSCSKINENSITYTISTISKNDVPALEITMTFKPDGSGITKLYFQDKAWGEDSLYNGLSDIKLLNTKGNIEIQRDNNQIILHHEKKLGKIQLQYCLEQDFNLPVDTKKTYRPIIQKAYFSVFSHNLFMFPEGLEKNLDIELEWKGFPNSYAIHNSFGSNKNKQKIKHISKDEFLSAIFTGGDYRIYPISVGQNMAYLAIRGNWINVEDSFLTHLLEQTLSAQRNFWNDHSQEYFTITMLPTHLEHGSSISGTGLTNSFAVSAGNNENLKKESIIYLFNHELMHNWIGLTIKNENEEEQYWFSEGFTEYFTYKNIASNNIMELNEDYFIQSINTLISNLYTSPVKTEPNSKINYENFWNNYNYEKLPYYRGAIYAFILDRMLLQKTDGKKDLHDLMTSFLEDARMKDQLMNSDYFIQKANMFLGEDLKPFHQKHIINGELFDLENLFDSFNLHYKQGVEAYDLGFTFNDRKIVTEVDPLSNVYKAGLRKGDQLTSWNILTDPKKEATISLERNGEVFTYNFYPAKEFPIPQLLPDENNKQLLK